MIRRRGAPPPEEDESSEEEDAFSALSSSSKAKGGKSEPQRIPAPTTITSSMKRHHGTSDMRKAKMDALLQELEAEKVSAVRRDRFVPEKKGSFVEPGQEHLTTNIFVGNLSPAITEEQMTDLFRQFGELYSLKIMWPRTPEERARNRNTGFVCFMSREDAEEAMEACSETDPFNVGRRLMLRWGKSVKMVGRPGTGGTAPIAQGAGQDSMPDIKRRRVDDSSLHTATSIGIDTPGSGYDPAKHGADAIHVVTPKEPNRAHFITTVASFVAKDGSPLEHRLRGNEAGNRQFDFLTYSATNEIQKQEHLYYKWRVYAFCQGDGFETWRTDPFVMLKPNGKYWVPPPLNRQAAWREEQAAMEREEQIRQQKAQRRRQAGRKDFMTGRQLEQAKRASGKVAEGGAKLTDNEIAEFNSLVREKLCASREAICEAMAFCFEKSGAAKQISNMLKELLLDNRPDVSVDTRIARLYLMSDVLYNSQQPGVRNAFLYRDAVERMAPDVFASMGMHGDGKTGRMTLLKLKTAVSSLLSAWTNWSVYNPAFIDELEARFDGRELPKKEENAPQDDNSSQELSTSEDEETDANNVIIDRPRGDWTEVTDDPSELDTIKAKNSDSLQPAEAQDAITVEREDICAGLEGADMDVDGEPFEEDDIDGESLGDEDMALKAADETCSPADKRADEPLVDDDLDGEELDGEPFVDDSEEAP